MTRTTDPSGRVRCAAVSCSDRSARPKPCAGRRATSRTRSATVSTYGDEFVALVLDGRSTRARFRGDASAGFAAERFHLRSAHRLAGLTRRSVSSLRGRAGSRGPARRSPLQPAAIRARRRFHRPARRWNRVPKLRVTSAALLVRNSHDPHVGQATQVEVWSGEQGACRGGRCVWKANRSPQSRCEVGWEIGSSCEGETPAPSQPLVSMLRTGNATKCCGSVRRRIAGNGMNRTSETAARKISRCNSTGQGARH